MEFIVLFRGYENRGKFTTTYSIFDKYTCTYEVLYDYNVLQVDPNK